MRMCSVLLLWADLDRQAVLRRLATLPELAQARGRGAIAAALADLLSSAAGVTAYCWVQ